MRHTPPTPSSSSRSPPLPPPPPHHAPLRAAATAPRAWSCCAEDLAATLHRRRRHDKVKLHGQTRDNTHQYQFMALPWIAKLPFLGIAGCDSVTAAMHTRLCSSSDLARRRLPETYNAVANGAADTSLSYSVHARESCVKPCRAHLQHFAKAQRG